MDTEHWVDDPHRNVSLNYGGYKGNSMNPSMADTVKSTLKSAQYKASQYNRYIVLATLFLMIISSLSVFVSFTLIKWYFMPNLYFWDISFEITPYMMAGVGIYTFIISLFGLAIKGLEKRKWFALYAVLLTIAFLGQCVSVYFIWQIRFKIQEGGIGPSDVIKSISEYGINPEVTKSWDDMQTHMMCCGGNSWRTGYTDYQHTSLAKEDVPDTCCIEPTEGCGRGILAVGQSPRDIQEKIFVHGCVKILSRWMENEVVGLIPMFAGVFLTTAFVEIMTVVLLSAYVAQITRRHRGDEIL